MRRRTLLLAAPLAALVPGSAGALTPAAPVSHDDLLRFLSRGGTLLGVLDRFMWVERYEPDGGLRGTYRGRTYAGRWEVEEDRLCTTSDGTRQCGGLLHGDHFSLDPRPMRDRAWYTLTLHDGRWTSMPVMARTDAPWQRRLPVGSLNGRVDLTWDDGFTLAGSETVEWVRTSRPHGLQKDEVVSVSGVTDGIVIAATDVRRRAADAAR